MTDTDTTPTPTPKPKPVPARGIRHVWLGEYDGIPDPMADGAARPDPNNLDPETGQPRMVSDADPMWMGLE